MSKDQKPSDAPNSGKADDAPDAPLDEAIPAPTKTPMYQAYHAARYQRQALISSIQTKYGRRLLSYVSGIYASIDRDDTLGFVDLLHNVEAGKDLDLLLHTGGGDIDAAEKLISMVRTRVGLSELRIIVPDFAKSAGTLMAMGADRILMSDSSELGPIDPQITLKDEHGNFIRHSVQNYLDAYESYVKALKTNPNDVSAQIMLGKLDPATVKLFESVRDRARTLAENQLKLGMFRNSTGNFTKVASDLLDTKSWQSHGQMISHLDAAQIGLNVDYLDPMSEQWQSYWQLYCLQRLAVGDKQKLFESDYASLPLDSSE